MIEGRRNERESKTEVKFTPGLPSGSALWSDIHLNSPTTTGRQPDIRPDSPTARRRRPYLDRNRSDLFCQMRTELLSFMKTSKYRGSVFPKTLIHGFLNFPPTLKLLLIICFKWSHKESFYVLIELVKHEKFACLTRWFSVNVSPRLSA